MPITKTLYTAEALATGDGRNGHVHTTDGQIDLDLAVPVEMGGAGGKVNPELLFASGYAACFHGALQLVAKSEGIAIHDTSVGARVHIGPNGEGGFALAVDLEVNIPGLPHDEAQALVEKAHQVCPYSNATRGNIPVNVTATDD
ncbi:MULTISPECIES: organic hydroperoxide resistance protein [unclassified Pseudoclavibacter]|uniref:organic hydroperoxide resistance protein n=1 Tax=unclassified Pseudoclavibacter TaxID=2615177 RepID=UPI001300E716|nr:MULTISPECIES: organic hydroperoxide resistance protein [unclassified Pseudoclavibacter]KAB1647364.1 organic hydroperoxide resistance protein [Pseudoclavibacter sp. CFCC 14310]KAB1662640.1 organic hydroperoxide resistance protein [Pseudoclavibacter sp. CFCC 13611]